MTTSLLHAKYYADGACATTVEVVENVAVARDTFRLRFAAPHIARTIVPGQFLMVKIAGANDPLLGRPLAVYNVLPNQLNEPTFVDVMYLVKGKFTTRACDLVPGQGIDVWGPLGNGFTPVATQHLVMVAGGIGNTPFLAVAQEYLGVKAFSQNRRLTRPQKISYLYGARTAAAFAGLEDFAGLDVNVQLATDDGSRGHKGLVTDLLREIIAGKSTASAAEFSSPLTILCCGPEPMMEAVAKLALHHSVPCQVSLETPMACGIGICFTCVAKIKDDTGEWDYKRTCVEGPIFCAEKVVW